MTNKFNPQLEIVVFELFPDGSEGEFNFAEIVPEDLNNHAGNKPIRAQVSINKTLGSTQDTCTITLHRKITSQEVERRTRIDIVFEKTIENFDAEVKRCPACATTSKGSFPANIHGPLQYGNGIKAYVCNLRA